MNKRRVGAFIRDTSVRDVVNHRLAAVAVVEYVDSPIELVEGAASGAFAAMMSGLDGRRDTSVASVLVDIAARAPSVPLVLYGAINRLSVNELSTVYTPGLPIELVVRGEEPLAEVVRQVLDARITPTVAPLLLTRYLPIAPAALRPFIALLAIKAPSRRSVEQLASWVGVTRRTISRRLRNAGWGEPHVVRQSFRAIDALWLISELGWSARQVYQARGFGSAGAVGRLTYRYTGISPASFRESGGLPAALEAIQRNIMGVRCADRTKKTEAATAEGTTSRRT